MMNENPVPGTNEISSMSDIDVEALAKELESIVSPAYVSDKFFERVRNAVDIFPYELDRNKLPYVVVMPRTAEEISKIMRYADAHGIPVYPRGSGTSLHGASRYQHRGIVINTRRMRDFQLFENMFYFECEPGVVCNDLMNNLEEKGYFLPLEPGSKLSASMGGLISNNTGAHIVDASIGRASDYVMGIEAVLPDGQIIQTGTKGLRRIAGTDLTKFFVGGDGLLGIITRIRMRLIPNFESSYGIATFSELAGLARGVQRMYMEKRPVPIYMEFMDYEAAKIGYEIKGLGDPGGAVLFFKSIGHTAKEAESKLESVLESFKAENPLDVRIIKDREEQKKIWTSREVLGSLLMQNAQSKISSLEVVSNLGDLVECMSDAKNFNRDLPILGQFRTFLFGHIGSLTLHPTVVIPKDWDSNIMAKVYEEKFQAEMTLNLKYGTAGGEWGQFARRAEFFRRMWGEVGYQFVKNIKKAIDPNDILNRGLIEGY